MFIYGIFQNDTCHYIGQTSSKPNLRFNWHVWAMRHPEHKAHTAFHSWMATQELKTLRIEVLAETDDPCSLTMLEGRAIEFHLANNHPLKNIRPAMPAPRRGHSLTEEHKDALSAGRSNAKWERAHRGWIDDWNALMNRNIQRWTRTL